MAPSSLWLSLLSVLSKVLLFSDFLFFCLPLCLCFRCFFFLRKKRKKVAGTHTARTHKGVPHPIQYKDSLMRQLTAGVTQKQERTSCGESFRLVWDRPGTHSRALSPPCTHHRADPLQTRTAGPSWCRQDTALALSPHLIQGDLCLGQT